MSAVAVKQDRVAFDSLLIAAVVALAAIGTIMVTSASVSIVEGDPLHFLIRHLGALAVGWPGSRSSSWCRPICGTA